MEGNIILDCVLVSCYGSTNHDLANFVMKPKLWFPDIIDWIFGIDDAAPIYVTTLKELKKWLFSNDIELNILDMSVTK